MSKSTPTQGKKKRAKRNKQKENIFINLTFNIALPVFILMKLSTPDRLGPLPGMFLAISFPLGYGLWDLIKSGKVNLFSVVGLVNTLMTGGFSFLQLNNFWFAVKEGSVPALFGIATLISLFTGQNLVQSILLNPSVLDTELLEKKLYDKQHKKRFATVLKNSTYMVAFSFLVSSLTNFFLAIIVLKSPSGTPEFNEELGVMTALSFPVNVLPAMIILAFSFWYMFHQIKKITGLGFSELVVHEESHKTGSEH